MINHSYTASYKARNKENLGLNLGDSRINNTSRAANVNERSFGRQSPSLHYASRTSRADVGMSGQSLNSVDDQAESIRESEEDFQESSIFDEVNWKIGVMTMAVSFVLFAEASRSILSLWWFRAQPRSKES